MTRGKKSLIVLLVMLVLSLSLTSAIKVSLGNAKMILTEESYPELGQVGELGEIEIGKTILVRNINDFPINIKLETDTAGSEFIEVLDDDFDLEPGEELKAEILLTITEAKRYEGKVYVFFDSTDKEDKSPGAVMSSTVIVNAGEDSGDNSGSLITGNVIGIEGMGTGTILGISTAVLIIVLAILLYLMSKKRGKKKK